MTVTINEEVLRAQGKFEVKVSVFWVEPISAAGGAVKTSDDLKLTFDLVGSRE